MSTNVGMFGYYPAPDEHPQSIARRTADLSVQLGGLTVCVAYAGQMFTVSGPEEEGLLRQLLAAQKPASPSHGGIFGGCGQR